MTIFWLAVFLFVVDFLVAVEVLRTIRTVKLRYSLSEHDGSIIIRRLFTFLVVWIIFTAVAAFIAAVYLHKQEVLKWTIS